MYAVRMRFNRFCLAPALLVSFPPKTNKQIVQFIVQNTGGTKKSSSAAAGGTPMDITGGFCDPFTGGGGGSRPPPQRPGGFQAGAGPMDITGGGVDPFTGGASSSRGSGGGGLPAHSLTHVPCHTYLTFDNVPNLEVGRRWRRGRNHDLGGGGA
jgi:phospholipase A-2-activating protein